MPFISTPVSLQSIFISSWKSMSSFMDFLFLLRSWNHTLYCSKFPSQAVQMFSDHFLQPTPSLLSTFSIPRNDLPHYFWKSTFQLFDKMEPSQVEIRYFSIRFRNCLEDIFLPNNPAYLSNLLLLSLILLWICGFWLIVEDKVKERQTHPYHRNRIVLLCWQLSQFNWRTYRI